MRSWATRAGSTVVAVLLAFGARAGGTCNTTPLADPLPGPIPASPFTVRLANVVSNLAWPIDVVDPGDGTGRLFVTERAGRVRVIQDGAIVATLLDISASTVINAGSAMSSIALHPDFGVSGSPGVRKLYTVSQEAAGSGTAHFGAPSPVAHQSVIYEWRVNAANPNLVDTASKRELLRVNEKTTVHNVDELAFGPDGYLYVSKGDDDMTASGVLDGTTVNGSVLRIDVNDTSGNGRYSVPATNPFVGADPRIDELWSYGFRNPWRMGFDRNNGVLYVADIGEDDIEEVNVMEPSRYYGWIDKEGTFAFLDFNGVTNDPDCVPPGFDGVEPIAQYDHSEGDRSITGGFVYRGTALPQLRGRYIFGDLVSGRLFVMTPNTGEISKLAIDPGGAPLGPNLIGIGEDAAGEILLVVTQLDFTLTGRVIRIVGLTATPAGSPPGVPDGTSGMAMRVTRLDPQGSTMSLTWDTTACAARGYHLLFGGGSQLPAVAGGAFDLSGARCDIGVTSPYVWSGTPNTSSDPSGLVWWLIVAHDGAATEGSWGRDGAGSERVGPGPGGASLECGVSIKSTSNGCGQ